MSSAGRTSRARGALLFALFLAAPPLFADRRDQKAADLYHDAVELIRKGKYKEGARKIGEALQRGATEPNEQQGSETRYLERRYDPYYWLGVAQMEMGLEEQALTNFEKSETFGVVKKWPEEWGDLRKRKGSLETRLAQAGPPPTSAPPPAVPTPVPPVVIANIAPTRPPPPPAMTATPIAIRIAGIRPSPTVERIVLPSEPPELAELRAARAELEAWTRDPELGGKAKELLAPSFANLDRALAGGTAASRRGAIADARSQLETRVKPALLGLGLRAALASLADARWDDAARAVAAARRVDPRAAQPELLECALLATRFVLEGRRDPLKIQSARLKLAEWRQKSGKGRDAMPSFLSPGLREELQ
ncbi:MAG TPA: hypothetical protein VKF32_12655 [Thermoanaerobaculia bacterium]|nr:hypothetical protein [Thermoanaerobaculia bacterium]